MAEQEKKAAAEPPLDCNVGRTGVGEWCAPGPALGQERKWMVVFEDADRGTAIFNSETAARHAFAVAEGNGWNCHLFQHAPRVPNADVTGLAPEGDKS